MLRRWWGTIGLRGPIQQSYSTTSPMVETCLPSQSQPQPRDISGNSYLIPTIRIERNDSPQSLRQAILQRLAHRPPRLAGGAVVLDLGPVSSDGTPHAKPIKSSQFVEFIRMLKEEFRFVPVGIANASQDVKEMASKHGVPCLMSTRYILSDDSMVEENSMASSKRQQKTEQLDLGSMQATESSCKNDTVMALEDTPMIVEASVRTGQQIYAKNRSLVVFGSVNSGAEVLADGSIHIFGALKGRALAGIGGHESAQIFALRFDAELVSICDTFTTCDNLPEVKIGELVMNQPTYVSLKSGSIVFKSVIQTNKQ